MAGPLKPLGVEALYRCCDAETLPFETTDELPDLDRPIGQERALEALHFGIGMRHEGYNLFALGPPGTGKHTLVTAYLRERSAERPPPQDWCYVNNFAEPQKPRALELPPGRGHGLREDMEHFVTELKAAIPTTFESDEYRTRKQAAEEESKERHEAAFGALQEKANARSIALVRTPMGLAFAPMQKGEVIQPEVFRQWPEEHQEKVRATIGELEKELQDIMSQVPQWEREQREKLSALNREVSGHVVRRLMDELRQRYADLAEVLVYFDEVEKDVVDHVDDFVAREPTEQEAMMLAMRRAATNAPSYRRYQVNVIVDHAKNGHAPVVYEDNPTHANLIGRVEHLAQFGALVTDFNLIRPGALHKANGGYLVLDAQKVLMQPFAWEHLKRALKSREVRIQGIQEAMGLAPTVSLEPEPIPIDLKVALLGDRQLYYLLAAYDPEFAELFKVEVDFDDRLPRSGEATMDYARLIATLVRGEKLKPFSRNAVGRVVEHAARLANDAERLTLHVRSIADVLREADFWRGEAGRDITQAADVDKAIAARIRRADRIRERDREEIVRETIHIDTSGAVVGQVNALSVIQIGQFAFGRPSRVTAVVRLGRGEVLDIEREAKLGGPLHTKGVMILSGFLGERFGRDQPIAVAASLVFEQSYGGVDGDSASSTELYALLSALSDVPIRQCFAVTGSVNQKGHVQAIGGVNEKIEGFFGICAERGLDGSHGVLIPASNVKHLMLRHDVVSAVEAGKFSIYPVQTIDQGIEILTGVPAGAPDADGNYPAGTINARVKARLADLAEKARAFAPVAREPAKREPE
ncbi:MAG: Lon protease family protein [Rhodospirillales bacterium]